MNRSKTFTSVSRNIKGSSYSVEVEMLSLDCSFFCPYFYLSLFDRNRAFYHSTIVVKRLTAQLLDKHEYGRRNNSCKSILFVARTFHFLGSIMHSYEYQSNSRMTYQINCMQLMKI